MALAKVGYRLLAFAQGRYRSLARDHLLRSRGISKFAVLIRPRNEETRPLAIALIASFAVG